MLCKRQLLSDLIPVFQDVHLLMIIQDFGNLIYTLDAILQKRAFHSTIRVWQFAMHNLTEI